MIGWPWYWLRDSWMSLWGCDSVFLIYDSSSSVYDASFSDYSGNSCCLLFLVESFFVNSSPEWDVIPTLWCFSFPIEFQFLSMNWCDFSCAIDLTCENLPKMPVTMCFVHITFAFLLFQCDSAYNLSVMSSNPKMQMWTFFCSSRAYGLDLVYFSVSLLGENLHYSYSFEWVPYQLGLGHCHHRTFSPRLMKRTLLDRWKNLY